jgi:hypothetical protein
MCEWDECQFQGFHVHNGKFYCFAHWIRALAKERAA